MRKKGSRLGLSKKGMIVEFMFAVVFVIVFALVSIFSFIAYKGINEDLQADPDFLNESKTAAQEFETGFTGWFDYAVMCVLIGLWFVGLAAAYLYEGHPVLSIVFFIIVVLVMIVGGIISNMWEDIKTESAEVTAVTNSLPLSDYVFTNYLVIVGIMGFSMILVFALRQHYAA